MAAMTEVLYLSSEEIAGLANPAEYVAAVDAGYADHGNDGSAAPRTTLANADPPGICTGYLALLPDVGAMGGYLYAAGFEGADAHFTLPLFDARSGDLIGLLDGASMNPYKTGAAGAVAVDHLAREDAAICAVIGSGAQARGQLRATATVRTFQQVRVYSPTAEHRQAFADEFNDRLDASVVAVNSAADAVADADVIITATTADSPVFDSDNLRDGAHISAIGQYDPEKAELDTDTIARSVYIPDLRDRVQQDAGSFLEARKEGVVDFDHIHAELGEVVAGKKPGRTDTTDITVFDSGGTGIETVAAAKMLFDKANEAGIGQCIDVSPASVALTGSD